MNEDVNLIEEARNAGQAYVESLGGDMKAICADLRRRALEEHREVVSLPPKAPHPCRSEQATEKKAG